MTLPGNIVRAGWSMALLAFGLGSSGCARRAPGPEECHALAVEQVAREARVSMRRHRAVSLSLPEPRILELTTECLTTPYDRELVQCLGRPNSPEACLAAFQDRRGEGRASP